MRFNEKLLADYHSASAWGIKISFPLNILSKAKQKELSFVVEELRDLSSTLEIAFINELQKRKSNGNGSLPNKKIFNFINARQSMRQPKMVLELFKNVRWQIKQSIIENGKNPDDFFEDDFVLRFYFPKPLEFFWKHQNGDRWRFEYKVLYEWGYYYRFLRDEIFWPSVNSSPKIWYVRLNKKGVHNGYFNYLFVVRAPSVR